MMRGVFIEDILGIEGQTALRHIEVELFDIRRGQVIVVFTSEDFAFFSSFTVTADFFAMEV